MTKRLRALAVTVVFAGGLVATALPAQADVCYDVDVVLNGDALVDEADCIEA